MTVIDELCRKYAYNIFIQKPGYTLSNAFRNFPRHYIKISNYLYTLRAQEIIELCSRVTDIFGDMKRIMNTFDDNLRKLQITITKVGEEGKPLKNVKVGDKFIVKSTFNINDLKIYEDRWNLAVEGTEAVNAYIKKAKYYGLPINEDFVITLRLKCMIVASDAKLVISLINKYKQGDLRINGKR